MKNVLFVGAHPDDIELTSGGTLYKLGMHCQEIFTYTASVPNEDRKQEMTSSHLHLGISKDNIFFGDHPDTGMYDYLREIIIEIEDIVKTKKVDTIFTHHPSDNHQDHNVVSQATRAVARLVDCLYYYSPTYPSSNTVNFFEPTLVSLLLEFQINRKLDALRMHQTQVIKYGEEEWIDRVGTIAKADAWKYGGHHGWAEVFQIGRQIWKV